MSVVACPYCDARLSPQVIAEGWCETCGKKIPAWVRNEAPATPAPRCPRCGARLTSGEMKAARCRSCEQSREAAGAEAGGPGDRGPAAVGSVLRPSGRPPGAAKPLVNPVRRQARLMGYVALATLALTATAAACGSAIDNQALTFTALWIGGLMALIVGFTALITQAVYAGAMDKELAAMQQGDCLAHWTYGPDEWLAFARADWARTRAAARMAFLVIAVAVSLALGGLLWLGGAGGVGMAFLIGGATGLGLGGVIGGGILLVGRLRYRHNIRGPGEAYIGKRSVYLNGAFWTWGRWLARLMSVRWVDGSPAMLELTIEQGAGHNKYDRTVRIPIPGGRENEARRVLREWGWPHVGPEAP